MSLIEALKPLLGHKTVKVDLQISAHDERQLAVVAKPVTTPIPANAGESLTKLMAGLAMPIKVIDTPEAIEQAVAAEIAQAAPTRNSWDERVRALELDAPGADQARTGEGPSAAAEGEANNTDQPDAGADAADGGAPGSGDDETQEEFSL